MSGTGLTSAFTPATTSSIFAPGAQGLAGATNIGAGISGAGTGGGFGLTAGAGAGAGAGSGALGAGGTGLNIVGSGAGGGAGVVNPGNFTGMAPQLSNTQLGMIGGTAGLGGLMQAERDQFNQPTDDYDGGPLQQLRYDPKKFRASSPTYAPDSVYRPTYAAEGGIMKLAQGGMPNPGPGPVEQMSRNVLGGQSNMFPQSQQETVQFAEPTQMPASAEIIRTGYEAKTDPYTGVPTNNMAAGGIARYDVGGIAAMGMPSGGQTNTVNQTSDQGIAALQNKKRMLTKEQIDAIKMQGMPKGTMQDIYGEMASKNLAKGGSTGNKDMIAIDDYIAAAQSGGMSSVMAKAQAGDYNAMIALNKVRKTPNQNYARGGHLGGYSDGGRMLKGPGDGMSDNIPASIAGKQPARLADGEFVVPADVVSHLGNGSTDAGAKQLYAMMNRVRKARTGNPKQGKQIKPAKYMAA
jgi:hypothetical protein